LEACIASATDVDNFFFHGGHATGRGRGRSPRGISGFTRATLAKTIAKMVKRFINASQGCARNVCTREPCRFLQLQRRARRRLARNATGFDLATTHCTNNLKTTGYMFGKGVYFADMMSKVGSTIQQLRSRCLSQRIIAHMSDSTGLLLLCEVAAKPFYEQTNANYTADELCKASNKRSTKGIGRTQPVKWHDTGAALDNPSSSGCHMPIGAGQNVNPPSAYLQYNEVASFFSIFDRAIPYSIIHRRKSGCAIY